MNEIIAILIAGCGLIALIAVIFILCSDEDFNE